MLLTFKHLQINESLLKQVQNINDDDFINNIIYEHIDTSKDALGFLKDNATRNEQTENEHKPFVILAALKTQKMGDDLEFRQTCCRIIILAMLQKYHPLINDNQRDLFFHNGLEMLVDLLNQVNSDNKIKTLLLCIKSLLSFDEYCIMVILK